MNIKLENMIEIFANKRTLLGTTAVNRLRKSGVIPALLIDTQKKSLNVEITDKKEFIKILSTSSTNLFMLKFLDSSESMAVKIQVVQREPISLDVLHVDFIAINI